MTFKSPPSGGLFFFLTHHHDFLSGNFPGWLLNFKNVEKQAAAPATLLQMAFLGQNQRKSVVSRK